MHLGSKVTLMARSTLLSKEDPQIGETLMAILQKEGMEIKLHHLPDKIHYQNQQFSISFNGETTTCNQLLIATGRQSNADKLELENTDIKTTEDGSILVNDYLQTSVKSVYAVGDCTALPQYVYVAAAAGTRAGRNMTGEMVKLDLNVLPTVVFTEPQLACVGLDEKTAQQQGIEYESRTLPLENVPRALPT